MSSTTIFTALGASDVILAGGFSVIVCTASFLLMSLLDRVLSSRGDNEMQRQLSHAYMEMVKYVNASVFLDILAGVEVYDDESDTVVDRLSVSTVLSDDVHQDKVLSRALEKNIKHDAFTFFMGLDRLMAAFPSPVRSSMASSLIRMVGGGGVYHMRICLEYMMKTCADIPTPFIHDIIEEIRISGLD